MSSCFYCCRGYAAQSLHGTAKKGHRTALFMAQVHLAIPNVVRFSILALYILKFYFLNEFVVSDNATNFR